MVDKVLIKLDKLYIYNKVENGLLNGQILNKVIKEI